MNTKVCLDVCRTVFAGTKWWLLEHGTIVCCKDVPQVDDKYAIATMNKLATALGPYSGEGSPYGDCNPMKLVKFPGWLVSFNGEGLGGMVTYVGPEELEGAPPPSPTERFIGGDKNIDPAELAFTMRVAVFGRHKRNLDARSPKIVARSTVAS